MNNKNIFHIIKKLENDDFNYDDLKILIDISFSIALSHIRYQKKRGNKFPMIGVEKIEDIAIDAVAPLFIESVSTGQITLVMSLQNWNKKIEKESDAQFFLYKIVWSRVEQTLTELIKQNDPFFNKIHKTLTTCIINYNLKKTNYLGRVYVTFENIELEGKIIPEEEFNALPYSLFLEKQYALFENILNYIEEETDYIPAIPFNLLIKKIKLLNHNNFSVDTKTNYLNEFLISEVIKKSLGELKIKINHSYVATNKITELEAAAIYKSIETMSHDMRNGGINNSLYSYLSDFIEDLSQEKFYTDYHGIMNYLYKFFTKRILENLEN